MSPSPPESSFSLHDAIPSVADYRRLRHGAGWDPLPDDALARGLATSLYSVCAHDATGRVIACGRLVGDGGFYYYLQDVVVEPAWQRRGIGTVIVRRLLDWLDGEACENAFIGLMAAEGSEAFYHRFGFEPRPPGRPGMFKIQPPSRDD